MEPQFNFDTCPDRSGFGSLKWDKYAGRDILPMWVADMDFESPPAVVEALMRRVGHRVFGYTKPYESVEEAVLTYLARSHGVQVGAEDLVWLPGLVPALNVLARACAVPGMRDEVVCCTPVYPPFLSAPENQYQKVVSVPLVYANGVWEMDFDALDEAMGPRTAVFVLCNPHNPVGRVFSRESLLRLADLCVEKDVILCSDEIHCDLILEDGLSHTALHALDHPVRDRLISMFAPSKTYNLPGLSCAFAVIDNRALRNRFKRAAQGFITEVNALGYAGCEAAYRFGEPWRLALLKVLRRNRDLLYAALEPYAEQVQIRPMEATYLAWMDMTRLRCNAPCAHFESFGIGLSDGAPFGAPGFLRFNFGAPESRVREGIERLIAGIEGV